MRRIVHSPSFLLFIPLVMCLAGCADQAAQAPTAPTAALSSVSAASAGGLSSMTAAAKLTKPDVPFRGAVTGELTVTLGSPSCPAGTGLGVTNATGQALHMGNITYHTRQCIARNPDLTTIITGMDLVVTAANGDELHGTFSGRSKPAGTPAGSQTLVEAKFLFTGGTGRFENATGRADMTAVLNTAAGSPFPGRWEWTGTIRY
jgi:hypothetical protein